MNVSEICSLLEQVFTKKQNEIGLKVNRDLQKWMSREGMYLTEGQVEWLERSCKYNLKADYETCQAITLDQYEALPEKERKASASKRNRPVQVAAPTLGEIVETYDPIKDLQRENKKLAKQVASLELCLREIGEAVADLLDRSRL